MKPVNPLPLAPVLWLFLVLLGGCSTEPVEPPRNIIKPIEAPEFDLPTLQGAGVNSSTLKGKVTVLTFWTTWAPSAVHQLQDLEQLYIRYREQPVQIIAVSLEESGIQDLQAFLKHGDYPFTILQAPHEFHQKFGGIDALPSTFIINPQWKVINRYTGRASLSVLSAELDWLLRPKE